MSQAELRHHPQTESPTLAKNARNGYLPTTFSHGDPYLWLNLEDGAVAESRATVLRGAVDVTGCIVDEYAGH